MCYLQVPRPNDKIIHGIIELQLKMRLSTVTVPKTLIFNTILYAKLIDVRAFTLAPGTVLPIQGCVIRH